MAWKRYTPEQIVAVIREAERGVDRKAPFRKHGVIVRGIGSRGVHA